MALGLKSSEIDPFVRMRLVYIDHIQVPYTVHLHRTHLNLNYKD